MPEYYATISWERGDQDFTDNQYSREHVWAFDGGSRIQASSSPHIVPPPCSVVENVDPEEAFVAALSSCHMLFFLAFASKKKFRVDSYVDEAVGVMEKDAAGKSAITKTVLRPKVTFSGEAQPTREQLEQMHHLAHENCFIANSVKTEVIVDIIE